MEEFLTVEEIATRLKVTKKTVYDWMKAGNLRYVQVGLRSRRVPVSAFRKFLEEREHGLGESPLTSYNPKDTRSPSLAAA